MRAAPGPFRGASLLLALVSTVVALLLAEGFLALLLAHPRLLRRLPGHAGTHLRAYHLLVERPLVQTLPGCVRYDPVLFYTLRPGTCRFRSREFDTTIEVDSAGFRDDEVSLRAPEVVVAGDSFAMGWGVEGRETFAEGLQRASGLRVLNTGVSSWGTAREMVALDRVDTSRLRALVVQYEGNDAAENLRFEEQGGRLSVGSQRKFEASLLAVSRENRYFPGRHLLGVVQGALGRHRLNRFEAPPRDQARAFVHALTYGSHADLSRVLLVVLDLGPWDRLDGSFAAALREHAARPRHLAFVRGMVVLEARDVLVRDDYFDLDDHIRASGHAKLAALLAATLSRLGVSAPRDEEGPEGPARQRPPIP